MEVKTQLDRRKDGKFTITVKLVGWTLNELRAFIGQLWLTSAGKETARQIAGHLEKDLRGSREPTTDEEDEVSDE